MNNLEFILNTELFMGMAKEEAGRLLQEANLVIKSYVYGDLVYGLNREVGAIGIMLKGKVHAMKYLSSGKNMILKVIQPGDTFGVGSVFSEKDLRLSYMEVSEESLIAFISESSLIKLFKNENFMKNYVKLLNSRIRYLNHKVDILSQSSIRDKVLMYIYDLTLLQGNKEEIILSMSKQSLADYLGVSRGSLYRVLDELEEECVLMWKKDKIMLLS